MASKIKIPALLLASLGLISLSSCNGSSIDTIKAMESNYDNEDKSITLIGEFDAPLFTFSSGKSTFIPMNFVVKSSAFSSEKFTATSVILPIGTNKNNVLFEIPMDQKKYSLKDFYVVDNTGEKINLEKHTTYKMTGTVHYTELEKPESERDNTNFNYKITNVIIEKD
ncbi:MULTISPECIES: hypothetical protein [Sphingobacterium]|uniref:hypothetical protein n=1 Tax=Sphingobacterium TaxID=28453 RepID=UPI00104EB16F|nr:MULTISPECIES: hypothetical protein [Sphingobacterium]MCW2263282.1 hypothetical protein [Sphingobacterium kitahiroshimense]TCR11734.1 hypothetical protein EDF67_103147 [Sphingobacterium sp. JUb78]